MRHPRTSSALALLVVLAGCGGKSSSDSGDKTATDPTRLGAGWHSTDVTIRDGHVEWGVGAVPSASLPPTFTSKWTARLDVHATAAGVVDRAVFSTPYQEVTEYRLGAGGMLTPTDGAYGLWFRADSDARLGVHVSALSVTGATVSGTGDATYVVAGDEATDGTGTFVFSYVGDVTAPKWSTPTLGAFADLPLPWEPQTLTLSEPANPAPPMPIFVSSLRATITPILTKTRWLGETEDGDLAHVLGASLVTDQWDSAASSWTIQTPPIADFVGHAVAAQTLTLGVAPVHTLESSKVTGDLDPSLAHTWGPVSLDATCRDGTGPCWHLGPVTVDYCLQATVAGFALSLSGAAKRVAIEVRAVGKPVGGAASGVAPGQLAFLQYSTPGATPATESIAFDTGTATAGLWDSGWQRIERPLPPAASSASSAGIALSIGGMGAFGASGRTCDGPIPGPWSADVYVRLVEVLP